MIWYSFTTKDTKVNTKFHKVKIEAMDIEKIFKNILDCSFKLHSALGPGLLESAYTECLYYELEQSGYKVEKQKPLPLIYKEVKLDAGYRIDLLVKGRVVIEIKSVDALADIHLAQILTYLKLSGCKLGLLVNFNVVHLKEGIKRVVL
jgi:GxxExxY protein